MPQCGTDKDTIAFAGAIRARTEAAGKRLKVNTEESKRRPARPGEALALHIALPPGAKGRLALSYRRAHKRK